MRARARRGVLTAQAAYYLGFGVPALVGRRLFRRLVGAEGSPLLVEENGALFTCVGTVLALGARRPTPERAVVQLGTLVAALTAAVAVRNRRTRPAPFTADMLIEAGFAAGLVLTGAVRLRPPPTGGS